MRLTLYQQPAVLEDISGNVARIASAIRAADTEVFLTSEMAITGYLIRDGFFRHAMALDDPVLAPLLAACSETGTILVAGLPERHDTHLYNTAMVIGPEGLMGRYRKTHFPNSGPFEERLYFAPGQDLPLFPTPCGKMALTICYDLYFPELFKRYALAGAELIVNISASPSATRFNFETLLPARAIETTTYVAFCNVIGKQRDMVFWGGSRLIDPKGRVVGGVEPFTDGMVTLELDHHLIEEVRRIRRTLVDTRPDLMDGRLQG